MPIETFFNSKMELYEFGINRKVLEFILAPASSVTTTRLLITVAVNSPVLTSELLYLNEPVKAKLNSLHASIPTYILGCVFNR